MAVFLKIHNPSEQNNFPAKIDSFMVKFYHGTIKVKYSKYYVCNIKIKDVLGYKCYNY